MTLRLNLAAYQPTFGQVRTTPTTVNIEEWDTVAEALESLETDSGPMQLRETILKKVDDSDVTFEFADVPPPRTQPGTQALIFGYVLISETASGFDIGTYDEDRRSYEWIMKDYAESG